MRKIILVVPAILLGTLAACGSSGPQAASFMAQEGTTITFLQWQPTSSNRIQGTMIVDTVTVSSSATAITASVHSQSAQFTGTVNGSSVPLSFSQFPFAPVTGSLTMLAELHGTTLALHAPEASGVIRTHALRGASITAYDHALLALRRLVQRADSSAPTQSHSRVTVCTIPATGCTGRYGTTGAAAMLAKPTVITNSGDGSAAVRGLAWSGWGTPVARGTGLEFDDNCHPDCATGTFFAYPAVVTLSDLKTWSGGRAYSRMVITERAHPETFASGLVP